jgi:hypothetical protein
VPSLEPSSAKITSKWLGGRSSAKRPANKGSMLSASLRVGITKENLVGIFVVSLGSLHDVNEETKDEGVSVSGNLNK